MTADEKESLHRIDRMETALFGTKPDGTDGVVALVAMHNRSLYGTDRDPGGLEKAVRTLTRSMWFCTGIIATLQFILYLLPIILKLKGML